MQALEHLSILVALLLAMAAALVSSDAEARREVTAFFAEAFRPQAADLGGDVGYLAGMSAETVSGKPYPIVRASGRPLPRDD